MLFMHFRGKDQKAKSVSLLLSKHVSKFSSILLYIVISSVLFNLLGRSSECLIQHFSIL